MTIARINTPLGIAEIKGDDEGLQSIIVSDSFQSTTTVPSELNEVTLQLQEYFKGERQNFDLKLNLQGTDFQKKVWTQLQNIPFGTTISYLALSKELGDEKAIRAVAAANGKNPVWIVVPCHRVIGSDGSLTGYAGGLHRKKWLLDHENPPRQQSLF